MQPIGLLMREHRLIEKMVERLRVERARAGEGKVDAAFIEQAVDFFRTYADRTHHGKEEDILFRDLGKKPLKAEHRAVMEELVEEHRVARSTVRALSEASSRVRRGDAGPAGEVEDLLGKLVDLYPAHIEKEDKRFFFPAMGYFTAPEQEAMLREFYEFDQRMIHEKYGMVAEAEPETGAKMMRCSVCGYIYDPARGDPEHGVEPGTPWSALPGSWVCPVCYAPKGAFREA